jgi:mannose-6-phosphate isomerase-like protein (cupin superfamily)
MNEAILRSRPEDELYTPERCFILELVNAPADPDLSIARARVEPGVTTARHALEGVDERYVVLQGRGRVEVGELPALEVGPGDVVLIPSATAQRITNVGSADLVFLCICTPGFTPGCYRHLEGRSAAAGE